MLSDALGRQAGVDQCVEERDLLRDRHRVRFGGGAEDRESGALSDEPSAMPDQALAVRPQLGIEWRNHRR
jgi:hypothetical protein